MRMEAKETGLQKRHLHGSKKHTTLFSRQKDPIPTKFDSGTRLPISLVRANLAFKAMGLCMMQREATK